MNRDTWVTLGVVGSGAAFGLLGAYSSFEAVNTTMQPSFGAKAWTVPIGMDLGIAVFSAMDLWMASRDTRTWWLRWVPHGLAGASVWFNVAGDAPVEAKAAHAGLVALWIVFVAVVAHEIKLRVVERKAHERLDRIRPVRWLLALPSTAAIWRWMVVNEQTSYRVALDHRNERRLSRADLKDQHGLVWRWKRSHRERELYRQGRLDPASIESSGLATTPATPPTRTPDPESAGHALGLKLNGDLDAAAKTFADELKAEGKNVTRRAMQDRFKIGTTKAGELAGRYR